MYQALYRKWRPKTFDDVVGQSHITETLKNQVRTDRLSHAYLFIGTRGTGKTTCAKILAKAVNCESPVDGNPCNRCRICRGIDDGSIMDVVEMDAASNNGVDNVRALRDEAVFSPATAKKRVYIVDEVHMLSGSAFNALLKILEEPPEHLMFILATTELNKVPATILSRCQRHSFRRLDTDSIIARLAYVAAQEQIDLTPDAAKLIAVRSEGGMRDALSMLDQCAGRGRIDTETVYSALGLAGNREIAALLQCVARRDSGGALAVFDRLWRGGKDPSTLLGELSALLRDLLLETVAPREGASLASGSFDDEILNAFRGVFTADELIDRISTIQSALADMRSGQAKMRCELTLITLCEPQLGDAVPVLRERVAQLERLVRDGARAPAAPLRAEPKPEAPAPAQPVPAQPATPPELTEAPEAPAETDAAAPAADENEAPAADAPLSELPEAPAEADKAPEPEEAPAPDEAPLPDTEGATSAADENEAPAPEEAPPPETDAAPAAEGNAAPATDAEQAPAADENEASEEGDADGDSAFVDAFWRTLLKRLGDTKLPIGLQSILRDPTQVEGACAQGTLTLAVRSDFARNFVDRPDVLETLSGLAAGITGAPVTVRFGEIAAREGGNAPADPGQLDKLKQFDIVKFK